MSEIYRANVIMSLHGSIVMNTWHLQVPDAPVMPTQLQAFVTGMITPQRTDTAASVLFEYIDYRRVDISGTAGAIYTPTGWPLAGADSGADLPSFAAVLMKGIASGQPRPNRIRKFLPGVLETDSSGSDLASTGITKADAIRDAWQAYIGTGPAAWPVAVSYKDPVTGVMLDNVGGRWNQITDITNSTVIAVMRSRKKGHGI